jgi:hypothetical protein
MQNQEGRTVPRLITSLTAGYVTGCGIFAAQQKRFAAGIPGAGS